LPEKKSTIFMISNSCHNVVFAFDIKTVYPIVLIIKPQKIFFWLGLFLQMRRLKCQILTKKYYYITLWGDFKKTQNFCCQY